MKNLAKVINISAQDEIVIDKGSDDSLSKGYGVKILTENGETFGIIDIVHKEIAVVRPSYGLFSNAKIGDSVEY